MTRMTRSRAAVFTAEGRGERGGCGDGAKRPPFGPIIWSYGEEPGQGAGCPDSRALRAARLPSVQ
jgi:hypothetical protein